jgi:hypothetical protein
VILSIFLIGALSKISLREKFDAHMPDFSTSCCLIPPMRVIDAGDQSKVSRSTVEGSPIGASKCCMHNEVPQLVRGVGILTDAYEKRL